MIELINDISQIMKKYGREYKIKIDPTTINVYIPISELLEGFPLKEEYIKIVYDSLIENSYIDLKQLNKIKKFIKKNEYEYIGLFFEDIEPAIEIMKYLNENSKAINELLYTSIDLQEGGDWLNVHQR